MFSLLHILQNLHIKDASLILQETYILKEIQSEYYRLCLLFLNVCDFSDNWKLNKQSLIGMAYLLEHILQKL